MTMYQDAGAWSGGYGGKRNSTTLLRVPIRWADERPAGTKPPIKLTRQQIANLLRNRAIQR
jgi:hypothetical protein